MDVGNKDDMLMEIFAQAGVIKPVARTLLFFMNIENGSKVQAQEIERKMGMRQPDVSIGTQELFKLGLIRRDKLKKEGKGRPLFVYQLAVKPGKILEMMEVKINKRIAELEGTLSCIMTLKEGTG